MYQTQYRWAKAHPTFYPNYGPNLHIKAESSSNKAELSIYHNFVELSNNKK